MKSAERKVAYEALMKFYPFELDDLPGENWEDISNYKGIYQVSSFGRVKRLYKNGNMKILKPYFNQAGKGYLVVNLSKSGKTKWFLVSRLVAQAFLPNPSNKPEVNHIDGHPLNNFVENLEWVTHTENIQHALKTRLTVAKRGEEKYNAKLTNEQAKYIRDNPERLTQRQLAEKFGIDKNTVSDVQIGRSYKNAGGKIRAAVQKTIPVEIRRAIRSMYNPRDREYGVRALARKYGYSKMTVSKIVNEKDD